MKILGSHHCTWGNKNIILFLREIFRRQSRLRSSLILALLEGSPLRSIFPSFLPVVWMCPGHAGEGREGIKASASPNEWGGFIQLLALSFSFQVALSNVLLPPKIYKNRFFTLCLWFVTKTLYILYLFWVFSVYLRKRKKFRYISAFLPLWNALFLKKSAWNEDSLKEEEGGVERQNISPLTPRCSVGWESALRLYRWEDWRLERREDLSPLPIPSHLARE